MDGYRRYPYFRRTIRAHEFAERQTVSMIDLFGRQRGLRRAAALWKLGIDTCDKLLAADAAELAPRVTGQPRFPEDVEQTRQMIEQWQENIRSLKAARIANTHFCESR